MAGGAVVLVVVATVVVVGVTVDVVDTGAVVVAEVAAWAVDIDDGSVDAHPATASTTMPPAMNAQAAKVRAMRSS